jgi:hypothetical protein
MLCKDGGLTEKLGKYGFNRQIFVEVSYLKYHENTFHGNRVYTFGKKEGRTDGREDKETDMMKVRGVLATMPALLINC